MIMLLQSVIIFFVLGSMIGWIFEVVFNLFISRKFKNRGFLKGPYIPLYGFGLLIVIFISMLNIENFFKFFLFLFSTTFLELVTGLFFLNRGVKLWDYPNSKYKSFETVISLESSLFWLFCSILFYFFVFPHMQNVLDFFSKFYFEFIFNFILIIMGMDFLIKMKDLNLMSNVKDIKISKFIKKFNN